jgi:hypothetical protein
LRGQECNFLGADGLDVGDPILTQSGKFFGRRIEHDTCSSRLGRVPGIGFCSVEHEAVVVSLRSREALCVHHKLEQFNPLH